uniref:Uncharacterized protein n=1 Tax=Trypanosoma vivax (strain Y486) TaxID=1055687 RepID=G0UCS9_TRYVY|nr:hypothetical protein TVY486_1111230 [Trypanosoma vivax Y486]
MVLSLPPFPLQTGDAKKDHAIAVDWPCVRESEGDKSNKTNSRCAPHYLIYIHIFFTSYEGAGACLETLGSGGVRGDKKTKGAFYFYFTCPLVCRSAHGIKRCSCVL